METDLNKDLAERITKCLTIDAYWADKKIVHFNDVERAKRDIRFLISELKVYLEMVIHERIRLKVLEQKLEGNQNAGITVTG